MVVAVVVTSLTISILLIYIGRQLHQIRSILASAKAQLEEYLRVVCESAYQEDDTKEDPITDEEKQLLWTREEKEQLVNEVLWELFQQ